MNGDSLREAIEKRILKECDCGVDYDGDAHDPDCAATLSLGCLATAESHEQLVEAAKFALTKMPAFRDGGLWDAENALDEAVREATQVEITGKYPEVK